MVRLIVKKAIFLTASGMRYKRTAAPGIFTLVYSISNIMVIFSQLIKLKKMKILKKQKLYNNVPTFHFSYALKKFE